MSPPYLVTVTCTTSNTVASLQRMEEEQEAVARLANLLRRSTTFLVHLDPVLLQVWLQGVDQLQQPLPQLASVPAGMSSTHLSPQFSYFLLLLPTSPTFSYLLPSRSPPACPSSRPPPPCPLPSSWTYPTSSPSSPASPPSSSSTHLIGRQGHSHQYGPMDSLLRLVWFNFFLKQFARWLVVTFWLFMAFFGLIHINENKPLTKFSAK